MIATEESKYYTITVYSISILNFETLHKLASGGCLCENLKKKNTVIELHL